GKRVLILGGTGPVGTVAAALAAQEGADVLLGSHADVGRARVCTTLLQQRYDLRVTPVRVGVADLADVLPATEVVIGAAKAGVEVLPAAQLPHAKALLVAADVNAVPPPGIANVGVMDDGAPLPDAGSGHAIGIGALAVGNIKYQVERGLFEQMRAAEKAQYLDFRHAFAKALDAVRD
ncbi:MAG: methylenetetrahydromethanopterin dehydrogenase, partial [Burkholderiales bacterium]|nr:methylenetetrahydromethanopterin dehydrogenase [Burkholderiales bacterium]